MNYTGFLWDVVALRVLSMLIILVAYFHWAAIDRETKDSLHVPTVRHLVALGWLLKSALSIQIYLAFRVIWFAVRTAFG